MKRVVVVALVLSLTVASFAASTAAAAKKKKKKAAPVATTLYLHGTETFGEQESYTLVSDAYLPMDTKKASGSSTKSKQLTNYVLGPNTDCAGITLFPVWTGPLVGRVVGDVKVTFHTISTPGASVDVRIWPDVNSLLCNQETLGVADYPDPAGSATVELPPGPGEVVAEIKGVDFKATSNLMLQITPMIDVPFFGRVLYDSDSAPSKIELSCIPAKGKTCSS
jgi:hypothetical protein